MYYLLYNKMADVIKRARLKWSNSDNINFSYNYYKIIYVAAVVI